MFKIVFFTNYLTFYLGKQAITLTVSKKAHPVLPNPEDVLNIWHTWSFNEPDMDWSMDCSKRFVTLYFFSLHIYVKTFRVFEILNLELPENLILRLISERIFQTSTAQLYFFEKVL